ncbi:MAG: glycosyltransferase family A protein [Anaerolineales bacterium]|nr:MAG: glycosyltransferase family A protein [Anaerolineales bacterium]
MKAKINYPWYELYERSLGGLEDMFCSAIIPTIGRASLTRAVHSILDQGFTEADYEIIVVNDTGNPLPQMEWQHSPRVRTIVTQKRERSVARNTGAAVARGRYLYFLDDDDIMLPGALSEFWELSQKTDARWLFGGYQTVDNDGQIVAEFRPNLAGNISAWLIAGEGIPLQASMFRTDVFYEAGEFDVFFTGAQDRDLERRISMRCNVCNTPFWVAQIRVGQERSSTDWSRLREFDRWGREKAFDQLNSFQSIWDSAQGKSHLHGRVCRAYLASAVWNLTRKFFSKFFSRLFLCGVFGIPYIFSPAFWNGVCTRIPRLGSFEAR